MNINKQLFQLAIFSSVALATPMSRAEASDDSQTSTGASVPPKVVLQPAPPQRLNRLSLSYRMGLNVSVDFRKLGGFTPLTDPGPDTGAQSDRNYDGGSYNRVDSSGNAGDLTWYWGYENPDSIQGDTIILTSSSSPATAVSNDHYDDPNHGLELSYARELYRKKNWRCGVEGAFGYSHLSVEDGRTLVNQVDVIQDTYSIPDQVFVIPDAPYRGTYEGPAVVIGSSPQRTRTIIPQEAIIDGRRALDADMFLFRLGPYVEFPVDEKLSLMLNGGLTLLVSGTDFSYSETVRIPGLGSQSRAAAGSESDFLVGGYIGGRVSYAVADEWSVFCGAQFQTAGRSFNHEGGKEAILDMRESVVVSIGVSYSF